VIGDGLLRWLDDSADVRLVGAKAARLARLRAAGLPVPNGFVITTNAYRLAAPWESIPEQLGCQILEYYRRMSSPAVAVRSSATAEDMAGASMAGQYLTVLNVRDEAALLEAVCTCWASVSSDRTRAYSAEHGLELDQVAMAVLVQELVPAEVAGVLFTANPQTARDEMLLEASWGLGEAVVSGLAQPDQFVLDGATGAVRTVRIADKRVAILPGASGPAPVDDRKRSAPCLNAHQVHALWELGLRVGEHFGSPQDIEWAIRDGSVYLLQSRPITTLGDVEAYAQCLEQARTRLRNACRDGRGEWVRHNLSETLPHPTPLTWSVIQRFMSGDGGFGTVYRMVGFEPSDSVRRDGFLELIAGRIYMDLGRSPEMFFEGLPYRYDLERLRRNPDAAQGPPTLPAGGILGQFRAGRRLAAVQRRIEELAGGCDKRLEREVFPSLVEYVRSEKSRDLGSLDVSQWLDLWRRRQRSVLDEFAPQSLLPSLIAAMAMDKLRALVEEQFWDDDTAELAGTLAAGAEPDRTIAASQGLYELAHGQATLEDWLREHGHRGPDEFDLAAPRWRERPEDVAAMAARLKDGASPLEMHGRRAQEAADRLAELERRLPASLRRELCRHVSLAQRYIGYREDGKYYLMLGYDLLRDMALDAGRRLEIGADVFLLTEDELESAMKTGLAPLGLIDQRRRRRRAEARIVLPHLITASDIDTLGSGPEPTAGQRQPAVPVSAGLATGPARIVHRPDDAGLLGKGYILVCPSTDPSWTPLFINAAGLVLECGGALSHGAVVARELGIPAVVCPDATRLFAEGEMLSVDAEHGAVLRAAAGDDAPAAGLGNEDPNDTRIPRRLVPPAPGRRERAGARLRDIGLLVWTAYLAAALVLPGTALYRISMAAMDAVLWPAVAAWGKPVAVAVIAVALAAVTMLGQWWLTDTRRLREAKRRAAALRKSAARLPLGSPRRQAMLGLAAPVQRRLVMAALVPLAVLLGPMVVSFLWWFPARVDPASWNPRPGATAYVVAMVDGECTGPVTLSHDPALRLDPDTAASQSLPPLRATLEARLAQWRKQSNLESLPWELQEAGRWVGKMLVDDLAQYLDRGIPPQPLAWTLYTSEDEPGRFPVTLTAAEGEPVTTWVVVGDAAPPEPREDLGDGKAVQVARPDGDSSIELIKVTCFEQKRQGQDAFWTPLAASGCSWDMGWLALYILAYVPAMLVLRWLLRIP